MGGEASTRGYCFCFRADRRIPCPALNAPGEYCGSEVFPWIAMFHAPISCGRSKSVNATCGAPITPHLSAFRPVLPSCNCGPNFHLLFQSGYRESAYLSHPIFPFTEVAVPFFPRHFVGDFLSKRNSSETKVSCRDLLKKRRETGDRSPQAIL